MTRDKTIVVAVVLATLMMITVTNGCIVHQNEMSRIKALIDETNEKSDMSMDKDCLDSDQVLIPIDNLRPIRLETATLALG